MTPTPAYYFSAETFAQRVGLVKEALGENIPLTYAIKANPFLLHALPDAIAHLEVCSPGELEICRSLNLDPAKILYSGVVKRECDLKEALEYGVDIITAESPAQVALLRQLCPKDAKTKVLFRLSSGNQFGMDEDTLVAAAKDVLAEEYLTLYGIHFYSGTQKKLRPMEKDLTKLRHLLNRLDEQLGYAPSLVEYGPGLPMACFEADEDACEAAEKEALAEALPLLQEFASEYPMGIELGRFLAAPAGRYETSVLDVKCSDGVNYALVDGGMHHLRYHGQMMGMQVPVIETSDKDGQPLDGPKEAYTICGSLCTVSDVLVRETELPALHAGDRLVFCRCGAYSVTEASVLFLSRPAPAVILEKNGSQICLRPQKSTAVWNGADA